MKIVIELDDEPSLSFGTGNENPFAVGIFDFEDGNDKETEL